MSDSASVERRFTGMLARIFSDGIVTDEERKELWTAVATGGLPAARVDALLIDFIRKSFSHFSADGRLSDSERGKLRLMVDELALSQESLPDEIRRALES
ncbi:hypothetical protein LZC95_37560 [Pendulispora brunnea]|uniref:Co-chaperone DjlA N-terminal domain-containing protein n=1 Tax=Pendulispora brunnea TaxID=2905690 RepID=A0ABZ2K243_9BACT